MGKETGLPFIKNFSPKDYGGYHSQNWEILQDNRGIMYFGNSLGVLEYDGVSWRLISVPNETPVRSLGMDKNGRIYLGASGEFGYLAADEMGQLQYVSLLAHVPRGKRDFEDVWSTWVTSQGIYFGSGKYLFHWDDKRSRLRIWEPAAKIMEVFAVGDTIYLQQSGAGLMTLAGDVLQPLPGGKIFQGKRITFMHSLPDADDGAEKRILLGTLEDGLYWRAGNDFRPMPLNDTAARFLDNNQVWSATVLADRTVALASRSKGLAIINTQGELQSVFNKETGLQDEGVWFSYVDREGGLWLALNYGLARVETPSPFSRYTDTQGLNGSVYYIVRHQGSIYTATLQGVYSLTPPQSADHYSAFQPVRNIKTGGIWLLPLDDVLLAGTNSGIFQIAGAQTTLLNEIDPYCMYQSRYDATLIFVGHRNGVSVLKKNAGKWETAGRIGGITGFVNAVIEEGPGDYWMGSRARGYSRVKIPQFSDPATTNDFFAEALRFDTEIPAEIAVFASKKGVPGAGWAHINVVDEKPVFFSRKGIRRFDPNINKFIPDSTFGIMFADTNRYVSRVVELAAGKIWIESSRNKRPERGILLRQENGQYRWYTTPFLRFADFDRFRTIYADPLNSEVIWLGGLEGIIRYDAGVKKNFAVDYPALMRKVLVEGDSVIYGGAVALGPVASGEGLPADNLSGKRRNNRPSFTPALSYAHNAMRFQYAAPSFDDPTRNRYQVYLEGFDKQWSNWTAETQKDYTNLPEGNYRFRVRAKNIYGHESSEGIYGFTILPPWYRTWWAYLCSLLLVAAAIFLGAKVRFRQLERKTEELEELVRERTAKIKAHESQLMEQAAELQELNQMKSRFFANISHEFRTPLTLILGPLEHLLARSKEAETRQQLPLIIRNGKRLLQLINQLLDLSRLEAGGMAIRKESQDLITFLKGMLFSFSSHADQRKIDLSFHSELETLLFIFDQEKFEKIFTNLLSNAFKFTENGGSISVAVAANSGGQLATTATATEETRSDSVQIIIRDTGVGIPAENLPYIFDRFYQVDSSTTRDYEGSGIGLALTKELVELHSGRIFVESEVGKGTTFTVRLPLGKMHLKDEQISDYTGEDARTKHPLEDIEKHIEAFAGDASPLTPQQKDNIQRTGSNDELILIVEDHPDMRTYIRQHLGENYQIMEAGNGERGFEIAIDKIPDLIVSDVMMPKMGGFELCEKLKTDERTSHIPLILLTAKAEESDKLAGLETGADDYLVKPFNAKELQLRVKNLITQRRKLREKFAAHHPLKPAEVTVTSIDQKFLEKIISIVETHLADEKFNVEKLADEANMHKKQLTRKLKALTGQAPGQLITSFRLQRAAELIEKNAGTIADIAFETGFNTPGYFSQVFRKHFGCTPGEYRERSAN